ncbi:LysR family transcriptional regulator [Gordonia sp. CPCC 205515]|uniref:LysR family transcriptional regulator n=1 Tax=Gordonia sp. CPCC 205515 TaxID=3140791 RepID=UPI003AF3E115
MGVELRYLRAFLAVVEEGTFTDAAIALDVSQAAVSRSVAALEAELGAHLLQRGLRETTLTDAGRRVVAPARRVLADIDEIVAAVESDGGEIGIGYAWAALGARTVGVQEEWARRHPDRELVFVQSDAPTAGLLEQSVDVAILRRRVDTKRIDGELIGEEPRYVVLSSRDPLARRRRIDLADLAGTTIAIDPVAGTTTAQLWAGQTAAPRQRRIHNIDEWLTLIAGGGAVGITPESTVRQYTRPGVAYRRLRDVAPVQVWLSWRRGEKPRLATELIDVIRTAYAAE